MGNSGEVCDEGVARGVLAEEHGERHFVKDGLPAERHEFLEADFFLFDVGDFDADGGLALGVWNDSDVLGLELAGDVGGNTVDHVDFGAGGELYFIKGDDGACVDGDDFGVDAVDLEGSFEDFGLFADDAGHLGREVGFGFDEHVEAWELVAGEILDGGGHFRRRLCGGDGDLEFFHFLPDGIGIDG